MENREDVELYVFTDEDGNDVNVQVLDYFYYNGREYAVMTELAEGQEPWTEEGGDEEEPEIFFMEVKDVDDENVEFLPVEEELADKLFEIVSENYSEDFDGDEGEE
ncbi:MAG: DUF1292 domain-containing protein [Clostridia bacterium]|nr:DUF1292 domain-containing protein [Clostridia bacterium]